LCTGILSAAVVAAAATSSTCTVRYCTTRTSGSGCPLGLRPRRLGLRRGYRCDLPGAGRSPRVGTSCHDSSKTELCLS
jgi:hypothetical protein